MYTPIHLPSHWDAYHPSYLLSPGLIHHPHDHTSIHPFILTFIGPCSHTQALTHSHMFTLSSHPTHIQHSFRSVTLITHDTQPCITHLCVSTHSNIHPQTCPHIHTLRGGVLFMGTIMLDLLMAPLGPCFLCLTSSLHILRPMCLTYTICATTGVPGPGGSSWNPGSSRNQLWP